MQKAISTPIAIIVIIIVCAVLVGGFVTYRYFKTEKKEEVSEEETTLQALQADSEIKSNMSALRSAGEMYWLDEGESYAKLNCQHYDIKDICSNIEKYAGKEPIIHSSKNKWCAYIESLVKENDKTKYYCVDHSGTFVETTINPKGKNYCDGATFWCPPKEEIHKEEDIDDLGRLVNECEEISEKILKKYETEDTIFPSEAGIPEWECYAEIAEAFRDASMCKKIKNQNSRARCWYVISRYVSLTEDPNVCGEIEKEADFVQRDECYGFIFSDAIDERKDSSFCEKVKDQHFREECYLDFERETPKDYERVDREIETSLTKLIEAADVYVKDEGSYLLFCTRGDALRTKNLIISYYESKMYCVDTANTWIVCAQSKENPANSFCVDWKGNAVKIFNTTCDDAFVANNIECP